jgi:flagellar motor switch protein FliN/FliY
MSDNLSQEEIDKLTQQSAETKSAKDTPGTQKKVKLSSRKVELEYLTPMEADTLGEIGNISMGSSATTLSMLLSNKVEITTPSIHEFSNIKDLFAQKGDFITVEINYIKGIEGLSVFAIDKKDAAIIADLMMGGAGDVGDNPDIGELQLSAVAEAMNQMIGSASTSMASIFNIPVDISPPVVKLQDSSTPLDIEGELIGTPIIAVAFDFKVGDLIDSEMVQITTLDSSKQLIKLLTSSMKAAVDEMPTLAPKPVPSSPPPPPKQPQPSFSYESPPPQTQHQQGPAPFQQAPVTVQPVQFTSFDNLPSVASESGKNLDILMDIKLKLTVELGRTELPIKKVLELARGSIVELDKIAGEPVELFANGKLIATGEVVVIEDNFGLRITSIINPAHRIK